MPRYAGQMLPAGSTGAGMWVPSNGGNVPVWRFPHYHAACGWLVGMTGIYVSRVPNVPGWSVLLVDDPAGVTLPPDTPTAVSPPTAAPPTVAIDVIGNHAAGAVPVSGDCGPTGTAVEVAPLIGGVPGTFVPMVTTGARWAGNVTMVAGTGVRVRSRVVGQSFILSDSAPFNVT